MECAQTTSNLSSVHSYCYYYCLILSAKFVFIVKLLLCYEEDEVTTHFRWITCSLFDEDGFGTTGLKRQM